MLANQDTDMPSDRNIIADFFPINRNKIPPLYAYKIQINGSDSYRKVGAQLSYRLRTVFAANNQDAWFWSRGFLISTQQKTPAELQTALNRIWEQYPQEFYHLHAIVSDPSWQPNAQAIADYVNRNLLQDKRKPFNQKIQRILKSYSHTIQNLTVRRNWSTRGWDIWGEPAISISITSELLYNIDFRHFANRQNHIEDLIGLWVLVKAQDFKGKIVEIVGQLKEHRERLLALTKNPDTKKMIQNAPDSEWLVKIKTNHQKYDYLISALQPIVTMDTLQIFNLNADRVVNALRLSPEQRYNILDDIMQVLHRNLYSSQHQTKCFTSSAEIYGSTKLKFGNDKIVEANDGKSLLKSLQNFGVYKKNPDFASQRIQVGVLDGRSQKNKTNFSQNIKDIFHKIGFKIGFEISKTDIQNFSRVELEKAVSNLQAKNPHLLLFILPNHLRNQEKPYELLKSITINNDLPSQCIYESTLDNQYALGNMVLGILGKTGNIPFVLADPLPFTDFVVGLDVAREKKKDLPGSINTTAIARIYCNDGDLVKYTINDTAIEGETIPDKVLEALFPYHHFAGKCVVIHRDGLFRGNEKAALQQRAAQLGATFYLVEIIKNDAPRLYCQSEKHKSDENPHGIVQPAKGTIFKISETEAFLVSSLPPFQNSTPQPLHLRSDTSLGIDKAIKSVLALTLLHYGSLRPPRLPVSIHYSDKIGYLALRGIRPNHSQGQIPFWL